MSGAFAHLDAEQRGQAEALAERFRAAGAEQPEAWAASEVEDDIPQLARFLFLRRLWRAAGEWKQPPAEWFAEPEPEPRDALPAGEHDDEPTLVSSAAEAAGAEDEGEPAFFAAQQAVRRILAAGADPEDLQEVARAVFLHTAYEAVHTVDEGHDPEAGDGMPGWLLAEVGADLVLTGRVIPDLHADLLTTEPDENGSA